MRTYIYKLESEDFAGTSVQALFEKLQMYVKGNPKVFDPKVFVQSLDDQTKTSFESLYLQEVPLEGDSFDKEFESARIRLKNQSIKRRMHAISTEIKHAEKLGDLNKVKRLTVEFEALTKELA